MSDEEKEPDLSHLNEAEREAYRRKDDKNNLTWVAALFCAGFGALGVLMIFQETNGIHVMGVVKVIGFVALGLWARNWSRIACVLLLAWHIWLNHQYAAADRFQFKAMFWLPAAVFLIGIFFASGRASLIAKAQSGRREVLTPAPHTTGHTDP